MAQASVREVKEAFTEIVSANDSVISKLETAAMEAREKRQEVEETYRDQLSDLVTGFFLPVDQDALKKMGQATGSDIAGAYQKRMEDSADARNNLAALVTANGEVDDVRKKLASLHAEKKTLEATEETLNKTIKNESGLVEAALLFNGRAGKSGKPALDEASIAYFDSKKGFSHAVAWMFDSHYRRGRSLIKKFARHGMTVQDGIKKHARNMGELQALSWQRRELNHGTFKVESVLQSMSVLGGKIESEDKIIADLSGKTIKALDDGAVFGKAAGILQGKIPQSLVEDRARIEGFRKIERGLMLRANSLRKASGQLERQLPKLNKAVRRNGSRKITVDLGKIRKQFKVQQKMGRHTAQEMRKANAAVGAFKADKAAGRTSSPGVRTNTVSAGSDPLDFYMNLMILDMVMHGHHHHDMMPDTHAVNSVMGIPDSVAQDANVDLGNLDPQFSADAGLDGLSDGFNDIADVDIGDVDVGSIDIDVSSFDVPDVDVGGLDGGGFDGGGFDGGGFDGGGF